MLRISYVNYIVHTRPFGAPSPNVERANAHAYPLTAGCNHTAVRFFVYA